MTATLTIPETATELRISKSTVYRLIAAGQLEVMNVASRGRPRMRVPLTALERFIHTHGYGVAA
jgi:excisionase family DNA binding protein